MEEFDNTTFDNNNNDIDHMDVNLSLEERS